MHPWAEGYLFEYCYTHKTKKGANYLKTLYL